MFDPDNAMIIEGRDLGCLISEVRGEFFLRNSCATFADGFRQVNSLRVVIVEIYEKLSAEAQLAIVADLMRHNHELILDRTVDDIFLASDTPVAAITDLVCEVVWQALIADPVVRMEDEAREQVADY